MVSIPVRLYPATETKDIAFHQLHTVCGSRLKRIAWCSACDKEVAQDEIEKGYELTKGQHVVVTEEDLEKLPLPTKRTIQVSAFVKAEEIDPVYYEKSYYLEPDETGVKPFALFTKAVGGKGLTALGVVAIRQKERLCALRLADGNVFLETLFHPDEIREAPEVPLSTASVGKQELEMADRLVELLEAPFEPQKIKDQYREKLLDLIEAKAKGKEIAAAPEAKGKVIDLMEALKASVEAARSAKKAPGKKAKEEERRPARRRKAS